MTMEQKWIYIMYFWKYATAEQIWDMTILPVDIMMDYILEIWKDHYKENAKIKLNMSNKLLNSSLISFNKLHI